ncbi:MAG TPA: hypothetical protein VE152_03700, partial [Acidimicrobiales bacterium]|nr:hypothetical protein [Acidimicrobiales bacterium]
MATKVGTEPMPDPGRTPGQTFPGVTTAEVCTGGWATAHRDVTGTERHQVFASYGIPYSQHDSYELDHLIPLELGGDNAEANLWPELGHIPNLKDHLENVLHGDVCSGRVGLATAQHAIATNWWAAYQTYVGGTTVQ